MQDWDNLKMHSQMLSFSQITFQQNSKNLNMLVLIFVIVCFLLCHLRGYSIHLHKWSWGWYKMLQILHFFLIMFDPIIILTQISKPLKYVFLQNSTCKFFLESFNNTEAKHASYNNNNNTHQTNLSQWTGWSGCSGWTIWYILKLPK